MSGKLLANMACGSPSQYWNHVELVYKYRCHQLLNGKYVTAQKLDTSQSGEDASFAVNEIEIFHRG